MTFRDDSDPEPTMTTTTLLADETTPTTPSGDSGSLPNRSSTSLAAETTSPLSEFEHISHPSSSGSSMHRQKARLLYCKSHVAIHPTQFNRDNISGYLGVVEIEGNGVQADDEGKVVPDPEAGGKELLVTWVPDELMNRMDKEDRAGYKRVEDRTNGGVIPAIEEDEGFVFVTVPPPHGEKYAFSVPISGIYSMLVYPPSLQHWYGSATLNLMGGISLPTLFFHDDESPLLTTPTPPLDPKSPRPVPRAQWGFPPFMALIQTRATLLRSRLVVGRSNHDAELWLVNPSKSDREVHDAFIDMTPHDSASSNEKPTIQASSKAGAYPPPRGFPDARYLYTQPTPKQSLMTGLSNITNLTRKVSQRLLAHPLAQDVVPHLPPAVRSLVNVPGEWERSGRLPPKQGKNGDVASEFESARLYLARWARVVAEEGERARRTEVAGRAGLGAEERTDVDDLASSLGVFSLLTSPNAKRPMPHPTRTPQHPITSRDWAAYAHDGRDEYFVRREIFRRGFSEASEPEEKITRREGWEVLLGVVPWSVGGVGGGEEGKARRKKARDEERARKREEYKVLRDKWLNEKGLQEREEWKEEWHRIDVDCRRTDRTQPLFTIPSDAIKTGQPEREAGGPSYDVTGMTEEEEGGSARLNPHIAALRTILMTYYTYSPELGYVQGMSDLLSPIYVIFDANDADAFWALVGVMKMMEPNFLRDQSGMKRQLSTLQQLIGVMDPELYAHLDRTGSLNLFFCFRWILIAFKREFKFDDVIRLWEVLWTNFYSNHFVLIVALAILQSHRDVLIRYLTEFDEVLKYANDLSGTIELDSTLAQAEVLFLSFRNMVEDLDKENIVPEAEQGLRKRRGSAALTKADEEGKEDVRDISPQLRELLEGFRTPELPSLASVS